MYYEEPFVLAVNNNNTLLNEWVASESMSRRHFFSCFGDCDMLVGRTC
jgi:hypothetical protein